MRRVLNAFIPSVVPARPLPSPSLTFLSSRPKSWSLPAVPFLCNVRRSYCGEMIRAATSSSSSSATATTNTKAECISAAMTATPAGATAYPNSSLSDLRHGTRLLHHAWRAASAVTPPFAVDATAGRGSDTLILAELLGPLGTVHAFDVQQDALDETLSRVASAADQRGGEDEQEKEQEQEDACVDSSKGFAKVVAHHACHSDLATLTGLSDSSVGVVAYNLGWYPSRKRGDRQLVTTPSTTVASLRSAQRLLAVGGVISIMAYVGHPGGREEEAAVEGWAAELDPRQWSVSHVKYPNRRDPPSLLLAERLL